MIHRNVSVYVGTDLTDNQTQTGSENVKLKLIKNLLGVERTLCK